MCILSIARYFWKCEPSHSGQAWYVLCTVTYILWWPLALFGASEKLCEVSEVPVKTGDWKIYSLPDPQI